jgi:hypothetical protein
LVIPERQGRPASVCKRTTIALSGRTVLDVCLFPKAKECEMKIGLLFWILMLVWLLFGLWWQWPASNSAAFSFAPVGGSVLLFVVVGILGWKVFGPPLQA